MLPPWFFACCQLLALQLLEFTTVSASINGPFRHRSFCDSWDAWLPSPNRSGSRHYLTRYCLSISATQFSPSCPCLLAPRRCYLTDPSLFLYDSHFHSSAMLNSSMFVNTQEKRTTYAPSPGQVSSLSASQLR